MAQMSNCLLCGSKYEVCKMCESIRQYTPWRVNFDSPRHYQIYNVLVTDIRNGTLKDSEIADQIENFHLTVEEVKTFVPSVQETLMPFFEKPAKKEDKKEIKAEIKQKNISKLSTEK